MTVFDGHRRAPALAVLGARSCRESDESARHADRIQPMSGRRLSPDTTRSIYQRRK
jgi:hypothetical protein